HSMSAYALAIANRLVREYRDTDEHILGVLDAFYRHYGRTKAWEALVLTLRRARGASSDRADDTKRDERERKSSQKTGDGSRRATGGNGRGDDSGGEAEGSSPPPPP